MRIILLLGSSTAGKSSLCHVLETKYKWESISADEITRQIDIERSEFFRSEILKVLRKNGLIAKLQSLMTEDEIYKLCGTGNLTISKGDHKIKDVQFSDPSLSGLEEILKSSGFSENDIQQISSCDASDIKNH